MLQRVKRDNFYVASDVDTDIYPTLISEKGIDLIRLLWCIVSKVAEREAEIS